MKFDSSNLFSIDPDNVRRVELAIGIIFLLSAFSNFFFPNPESVSTGRWSWIYRSVTATFGPYGYTVLKVLIGLAFIAKALAKSKTTSKE